MFTATSSANVTGAPNASVTGASSTPSATTEVFAIRLTPSGAFNRPVTRLSSPRRARASSARNHSYSVWSAGLSASTRVPGAGQRPWVSQPASATNATPTSRSARCRRTAAVTRRVTAAGRAARAWSGARVVRATLVTASTITAASLGVRRVAAEPLR